MAGLFNKLKTYIGLQIFTHGDANAELDNIINHMEPQYIDDASVNTAAMQAVLSPGSVGSEVKATSLLEELKQLRYMLKSITGEAQWYSGPDTNINDMNALVLSSILVPQNRITAGKLDANRQPVWLDPSGVAATITLDTSTAMTAYIAGVLRTISSNIVVSGLTAAPSSNNTCLVNDPNVTFNNYSKMIGEARAFPVTPIGTGARYFESAGIPIDNIGSEISSLNGTTCAFKVAAFGGTEYFIGEVDTDRSEIRNCRRGFFFDSSQATVARQSLTDNDVVTLLKLTWVFLIHDGVTASVDVTYNQPTVSYDEPQSPAIGDYWLDLSTNVWKEYSGVSWATANAVFLGWTAQDSTNCIAARATDLFKPYSDLGAVRLERISSTIIEAAIPGNKISVYGQLLYFEASKIRFNSALHTVGTLSNGLINALYITDQGDLAIEAVLPQDRTHDLRGYYHPSKPWRAIGFTVLDVSGNFSQDFASLSDSPVTARNELYNADFALWQRGTSVVVTNGNTGYQADRWYAKNSLGTNGEITFSRASGGSPNSSFAAKLLISTAPTVGQTNGCELYQTLPNVDALALLEQKLSFRCLVRAFGNVNKVGVQLFYNTSSAKVSVAIGSEVIVDVSTSSSVAAVIKGQIAKVPSISSAVTLGVRIRISGVSTGNTYDLNNGFYVQDAILNKGEAPAAFSLRHGSYHAELQACQAFYEKSYDLTVDPATVTVVGKIMKARTGGETPGPVRYRALKRIAPTLVIYSPVTGTAGQIRDESGAADVASSITGGGMQGFNEQGGLAADGNRGSFHFTADAEI